jgi:hypothetical protein
MLAQFPHAYVARWFAALAIALTLGLGAALPASADATQWQRPHNSWNKSSWNKSSGWNRPWRTSRNQVIIGGGSGVIITGPGLVVGNPGFVVQQPGFIVGQPAFVVRRPNIIWERPSFAKKQLAFYQRHPSLRLGKPWWNGNWKHKHWKHKRKHQMHNGMN